MSSSTENTWICCHLAEVSSEGDCYPGLQPLWRNGRQMSWIVHFLPEEAIWLQTVSLEGRFSHHRGDILCENTWPNSVWPSSTGIRIDLAESVGIWLPGHPVLWLPDHSKTSRTVACHSLLVGQPVHSTRVNKLLGLEQRPWASKWVWPESTEIINEITFMCTSWSFEVLFLSFRGFLRRWPEPDS